MQSRFEDFKAIIAALTLQQAQDAIDLKQWTRDWGNYVKSNGDRPPTVPPTS